MIGVYENRVRSYPLADTTVLYILAHDLLAAAGELIPTRFPHRLLLPGAPNLINAVVPCFPAWVWRRSLVLKHLMIDLYQSRICRPYPTLPVLSLSIRLPMTGTRNQQHYRRTD